MRTAALAAALLALAACSKPAEAPPAANALETAPAEAANTAAAPAPTDALIGRWTGVEGMYLVVSPGAGPGLYRLEMQWDLDNKGSFDGAAAGWGVAFTRNGEQLALKPSEGPPPG